MWFFAAMNSLSLRFFGIGHLSIGKLREFLYVDWSSEDIIKNNRLLEIKGDKIHFKFEEIRDLKELKWQ